MASTTVHPATTLAASAHITGRSSLTTSPSTLPLDAIVPTASHRRQLSHTRPSVAITVPDAISGRLSGGSRTHMPARW
ncbi:hypothetical protein [Streptomyces sp. NPDC059970]|uniref:hypothetical protein n=1 Tax=Streptomyces sp. NPDC059970 TaxID=3347019 RepID=UPI00369AEA49